MTEDARGAAAPPIAASRQWGDDFLSAGARLSRRTGGKKIVFGVLPNTPPRPA